MSYGRANVEIVFSPAQSAVFGSNSLTPCALVGGDGKRVERR